MTESIRCHTLANGLVVLAEPMRWLESAAFTLLVPSGCVHDPHDRRGLTNFACEMALRGAGSLDSHAFIDALDNLGVERSESVSDAHTRFGAATLAENLPRVLKLYADVVRRPHLPENQLEAGRQVMLQELRAVEDEPSQQVMIELRRQHYPDPWGHPSHGERVGIEQTTIDDIRHHFAATYRPAGAILGVAGRFDWPALVDEVESLFGDWKVGEEPTVETLDGPPRARHIPFEASQTQIGISYPSVPYRDTDYFRAWAGVGVLSGGTSSRLFTEVRERRGLCYAVYATYHTLRDLGGVFCYAGTSADRAQETLDVTLDELAKLRSGVQPNELQRLKARIKSSLIMQQESSAARSAAIARDWYHLNRARPMEEIAALVDALTCESINTYLAAHPPRDFRVVTVGPSELEVPVGIS